MIVLCPVVWLYLQRQSAEFGGWLYLTQLQIQGHSHEKQIAKFETRGSLFFLKHKRVASFIQILELYYRRFCL